MDIDYAANSDEPSVKRSSWRMSLFQRIGGRGALYNLWDKLRQLDMVKSRKRKETSGRSEEAPIRKRIKLMYGSWTETTEDSSDSSVED